MSSVKIDTSKGTEKGSERGAENAQEYDLSSVSMPRAPAGSPFTLTPALKDLPVLELGDRGSLVQHLQAELRQEGFQSVEIDGVFGRDTEDAVRAFQKKEGLKPDGDVGPKTWANLIDDNGGGGPAPHPSPGRPAPRATTPPHTAHNDWRDHALKLSGNDPRFQALMSFIRRWEGGYTVDHAGPTNYGITKPFYQEYLKDNDKSSWFAKSIKSLTEREAIEIYYDQIWQRGDVGAVAAASERVGISPTNLTHKNSTALIGVVLGNGAVNYGEGRAERFLKEAFDAAGIPPGELADRAERAARRGNVDVVIAHYLKSEESHYQRLGARAKYDQYLEGWMNRHRSLREALSGPLHNGVPMALLKRDVE